MHHQIQGTREITAFSQVDDAFHICNSVTLALEDTDFDRALECIVKFKELVK